jgi:hypothetical protein
MFLDNMESSLCLAILLWSSMVFLSYSQNASQNNFPCRGQYNEANILDPDLTALACSLSMPGTTQPITHFKKYVDMGIKLVVESNFIFNNLISVDELDQAITMDFFFRLWWQDIRWNITDFWDGVPESVYYDGIELAPLRDAGLRFWIPDIHFIDVL